MILIYLVCLCALLYYFVTENIIHYWRHRGIPYEKSVPFFGNFYKLAIRKQNIQERIQEIYNDNRHRPFFGIHVFTLPHIVLTDMDMIKIVLTKEFNHFTDHGIYTNEKIDPIMHNGLFSSKFEEWKDLRKNLSPGFSSGKLKLMFPLIQRCGDQLREFLYKYDGKDLDFRHIMKYYAVDVIASCAFGIDSNCLDENNTVVRDMAMKLIDLQSVKRAFVAFCYFFIPSFVDLFRLKFANPEASKFFVDIFQETMKQRKEQSIRRNDLINLLHALWDDDNKNFNEMKMAANSIALFGAGSLTSALSVNYTLYELALNKDIQEKVWKELKAIKEISNGPVTYEDVQEMKYLDMVVSETLRKYPLTSFLDRIARTDFVFPEKYQLRVRKGDRIFIPVAGFHHDPEYFPNPDKYDPERFNPENKQLIVPFSYLPFGDGPRNCIGRRFALLNVKLALISILQEFDVNVSEETKVPIDIDKNTLFMEPKSMSLKLKRRQSYCCFISIGFLKNLRYFLFLIIGTTISHCVIVKIRNTNEQLIVIMQKKFLNEYVINSYSLNKIIFDLVAHLKYS